MAADRTLLGHPLGLYVLFLTEMWERFCYYGMRALLVLYMVNFFAWEQKDASTVYKIYTSFVFVTPILGGWLADRFLGNTACVVIGGVMMAAGNFCLTGTNLPLFYSGLVLLIVGNGFFKPNMSAQVGRLYPVGDARRDAAYTIFYMGINLGAFLAPLAVGWMQVRCVGEYHAGFAASGLGMILGLVIYLVGKPLVKELPHDAVAAPVQASPERPKAEALPPTESEAAKAPSVLGGLGTALPGFLLLMGTVLLAASPILVAAKVGGWAPAYAPEWTNSVMIGIGGLCLLLVGAVAKQTQGGARDRVFAILALALPVMCYWAAFEQKGNVMNLWADKNTARQLSGPPPEPNLYPDVPAAAPKVEGGAPASAAAPSDWSRFLHLFDLKPAVAKKEGGAAGTIPTTWLQAVNPLAIILLAPVFAWLWVALQKRGMQPSTPLKMAIGLALMSSAMVVMQLAAKAMTAKSWLVPYSGPLPTGIIEKDGILGRDVGGKFMPFAGAQLQTIGDSTNRKLVLYGVLTDVDHARVLEASAPPAYAEKIAELEKATATMKSGDAPVEVALVDAPPGFDWRRTGFASAEIAYKADERRIAASRPVLKKDVQALRVAAAEPRFRAAIDELYQRSVTAKVSPWWLAIAYLLATLGELCLSPVGLSMVSKLAPAKFATMLMGLWMLTSAFGSFIAGALGESWGAIPPEQFFFTVALVPGAAAVLLYLFVRKVGASMHGVK
ncbi:MAG TPA: peptide MFS transporter [Planctomycetia bacterium]|nr:peptide MFS transporter [Planctomycetia bacterium]